MPGSANITKIDFEFDQIDDVTFKHQAADYLRTVHFQMRKIA